MTTPRRRAGTGSTPRRSVRVDDATWTAASDQALRRNETLSSAIVRFLEHYARGGDVQAGGPRPPGLRSMPLGTRPPEGPATR